jgi:hypothetical protein
MSVDELVVSGVCNDLEEALQMFPIEMFEDFDGSIRTSVAIPQAGEV